MTDVRSVIFIILPHTQTLLTLALCSCNDNLHSLSHMRTRAHSVMSGNV